MPPRPSLRLAAIFAVLVAAVLGLIASSASADTAIPGATPTPDFSLAASPATVSVVAGGSAGTTTVTVSPLNGFNQDVSLSVAGVPPGATAAFSAATIPGGSGSAVLTIQAPTAAPGSYTLAVEGAGGGISHSVPIALTVAMPAPAPDFAIAASPGALAVVAGGNAASTDVTVSPINGFNGDVSLSVTGVPAGATAAFSSSTVASGSGTSVLTIQAPTAAPGNYTLTVDGSGANISHSVAIELTVSMPVPSPDFALTASPSALSIAPGVNGTSTVAVAPISGFASTVNLTIAGVPPGAFAVLSPSTIAGGSGNAVLTIQTLSAASGNYALTVIGSGGGLSHEATIELTVSSGAMCPPGSVDVGGVCVPAGCNAAPAPASSSIEWLAGVALGLIGLRRRRR